VRRDLAVLKGAGAVVFAVLALFARGDWAGVSLAGLAALLLAGLALRDVLAPVRLAADHEGLTVVRGFAGTRRVPWPEVERIEVGEHGRYGLRWSLLEIETGEDLHLFGSNELGAPTAEVAGELSRLRGIGPRPREM
jgi:hypothetical protein